MSDTPPTYRVRDWDKHFENHDSRKIKALAWVPVKNKHDGAGYRRVAALPNSVQVFCGWCLIIQVASKMPTRGVLRDDDGNALDTADLAAKTGFPESVFKVAFEALTQPKIRWLEEWYPGATPERPPKPGDSPGETGSRGAEQNRTEQKQEREHGREESEWIERIQTAYPDRSWQQETRQSIASSIQRGIKPEQILTGTKRAAELIAANFPTGIKNQYAPKARAFFAGELWENPEVNFAPRNNDNASTTPKRRDGGDLNLDDRYS